MWGRAVGAPPVEQHEPAPVSAAELGGQRTPPAPLGASAPAEADPAASAAAVHSASMKGAEAGADESTLPNIGADATIQLNAPAQDAKVVEERAASGNCKPGAHDASFTSSLASPGPGVGALAAAAATPTPTAVATAGAKGAGVGGVHCRAFPAARVAVAAAAALVRGF